MDKVDKLCARVDALETILAEALLSLANHGGELREELHAGLRGRCLQLDFRPTPGASGDAAERDRVRMETLDRVTGKL